MQDALIWGAIAASATVGALMLGVIKWVATIASRMTATDSKAGNADVLAAAALAKCEVLGTDFHNHRVETAGKIAKIDASASNALSAIANAENRFSKALEEFGDRIDKVVDRLDRVLEHQRH